MQKQTNMFMFKCLIELRSISFFFLVFFSNLFHTTDYKYCSIIYTALKIVQSRMILLITKILNIINL